VEQSCLDGAFSPADAATPGLIITHRNGRRDVQVARHFTTYGIRNILESTASQPSARVRLLRECAQGTVSHAGKVQLLHYACAGELAERALGKALALCDGEIKESLQPSLQGVRIGTPTTTPATTPNAQYGRQETSCVSENWMEQHSLEGCVRVLGKIVSGR
jgi:hypothetical protein